MTPTVKKGKVFMNIEPIRRQFPCPSPRRPDSPVFGHYCVGGAFCMINGFPYPFPPAKSLAEAIEKVKKIEPAQALRLATLVVDHNDLGDFGKAWGVLSTLDRQGAGPSTAEIQKIYPEPISAPEAGSVEDYHGPYNVGGAFCLYNAYDTPFPEPETLAYAICEMTTASETESLAVAKRIEDACNAGDFEAAWTELSCLEAV